VLLAATYGVRIYTSMRRIGCQEFVFVFQMSRDASMMSRRETSQTTATSDEVRMTICDTTMLHLQGHAHTCLAKIS
jgi:hypothetical protein